MDSVNLVGNTIDRTPFGDGIDLSQPNDNKLGER